MTCCFIYRVLCVFFSLTWCWLAGEDRSTSERRTESEKTSLSSVVVQFRLAGLLGTQAVFSAHKRGVPNIFVASAESKGVRIWVREFQPKCHTARRSLSSVFVTASFRPVSSVCLAIAPRDYLLLFNRQLSVWTVSDNWFVIGYWIGVPPRALVLLIRVCECKSVLLVAGLLMTFSLTIAADWFNGVVSYCWQITQSFPAEAGGKVRRSVDSTRVTVYRQSMLNPQVWWTTPGGLVPMQTVAQEQSQFMSSPDIKVEGANPLAFHNYYNHQNRDQMALPQRTSPTGRSAAPLEISLLYYSLFLFDSGFGVTNQKKNLEELRRLLFWNQIDFCWWHHVIVKRENWCTLPLLYFLRSYTECTTKSTICLCSRIFQSLIWNIVGYSTAACLS